MTDPSIARLRMGLTEALETGVWLIAIIILFVVEPPRLTAASGSHIFVRAAEFICAVTIALFIVAARLGNWRPRRVWLAAVILLVISVVALFAYLHFSEAWTCEYDGRGPIVIGATTAPDALEYARTIPGAGCDRLIQDYGGRTSDIWPERELINRHLTLAAAFLVTVIGFALAALCAIEGLKIGGSAKEPERPTA